MRVSRWATVGLRSLGDSLFSRAVTRLKNERLFSAIACFDVRDAGVCSSSTALPWAAKCALTWPVAREFWSRQDVFRMFSQALQAQEPVAEVGSPEVDRLYKELNDAICQKRMPEASLLPSLLQHCATPAAVKLAFDVVDHLRRLKAVQGQQKSNYSKHIAQLMVEACIRAGDPRAALKTLVKRNIYGFSPSLEQGHLLLKYSLGMKDTKLMLKVLKTMVSNEVFPTPVTADLVIRTCKEAGDSELLFQLAKEMRVNGVSLKKSLFDMLIATAANIGEVDQVREVQEWRDEQGIGHTTASAFALAKASVLGGKPEDAAKIISDHCSDAVKRDIYLQIMVKVWPLQVGAKVDEDRKESFLEDLKQKVVIMCENLVKLGCNVPVDLPEEFAKGAGCKSKAEEEVWSTTTS